MQIFLLLIFVSYFSSNTAQNSMNFLSDSHNFPQSYNRIVGGSNARLGQFPWQAVVYALKTNGN